MHHKKSSVLPCLPMSQRGRWKLWNTAFLLGAVVFLLLLSRWWHSPSPAHREVIKVKPLNQSLAKEVYKTKCRFYNCFEPSRCIVAVEDLLGVHVGDVFDFLSPQDTTISPTLSKEYMELLSAVKGSRYHVNDPSDACVFIPSVDTLSQSTVSANTMSTLLNSLPE